jgi:tetratricopeptide (TPR) repeat protein
MCPDFVDIRTRLGIVYRDMGNFHAAVAELEQAKRERPDYIPSRIYLGVTLFSLGRRDEAISEWEAVMAQDPGNKSAALYLRMVRDEHGPKAGSALGKD